MAKQPIYAMCIKNRGYAAALEVRKVYRVLRDSAAAKRGLVRIVDESGEDYLYPTGLFVAIDVPRGAIRAFSKKSA